MKQCPPLRAHLDNHDHHSRAAQASPLLAKGINLGLVLAAFHASACITDAISRTLRLIMRRFRAWLAISPGHALPSPWPLLVAVVIGAGAVIAADNCIAAFSLRFAELPATSAAVLAVAQALGTNGLTALAERQSRRDRAADRCGSLARLEICRSVPGANASV